MSNNEIEDYRNSKRAVGDSLHGGFGIFVQVIGVLLVLGIVFFFIVSFFN